MDGLVAGEEHLRRAERAENFPVALRVLPRAARAHLRAVYDVVRTVDDLGDDPAATPAERRRALDELAGDLARLWAGSPGEPRAPVLRRLAPTVAACGLTPEPFARLLEANRRDQVVTDYPTRGALLDYCALSAAPIGRLVLAVAGVDAPDGSAPARESDDVCAALQLLEHWADVGEDRARGRVYLPGVDRAAFGVAEADLDAPRATPALRALVRHETAWARRLLDDGTPLVRRLRGWPRLAVAGYVAGGRAAADALERTGGDVLGRAAHTRRRDVARHLPIVLSGRAVPAVRSRS